MENRKLHIDQLYRDKEDQFASLPPAAWNAMDNKLGAEPTAGGNGMGGGIKPFVPSPYRWLWYVVVSASVVLVTWQLLKPTADGKRTENQVAVPKVREQNATAQMMERGEAEKEKTTNEQMAGTQTSEERMEGNENKTKKESEINNKGTGSADLAGSPNEAAKTIPDRSKKEGAIAGTGNDQHPAGPQRTEKVKNKSLAEPINNGTTNEAPETKQPAKAPTKQQMDAIPVRKHSYSRAEATAAPGAPAKVGYPVVAFNPSPERDDMDSREGASAATLPDRPDDNTKDIVNNAPAATDHPANPGTKTDRSGQEEKETRPKTDVPNVPAAGPQPEEVAGNMRGSQTTAGDNKETPPEPAARKSRRERKRQAKEAAAIKQAAEKQPEQLAKVDENPSLAATAEEEKNNSGRQAAVSEHPSKNGKADLMNSPSAAKADKQKTRPAFEYGLKAGYETGLGNDAIGRLLAAPFLQYNLSRHLSVSLQPGIRYGAAKTTPVPVDGAYYNPTGTTYDSVLIQSGGLLRWQYTFFQHYDSIAVSYKGSSGAQIEFELPVTLRYQATEQFAFTAGVNFIRGKLPSLTETKQTYVGFIQIDTVLTDFNSPAGGPIDTSFVHTAQPYAAYVPFTGSMEASDPLRIGYMLGAQYTRRRWLLELDMLQQVSGLSNINDQRIKKQYAQPYFRLMLGIRFRK